MTSQLAQWVRMHAGEGAVTKRLSGEVMAWPLHLKQELLIGMFRGDGHQSWKRPSSRCRGCSFTTNYGTASPALALQTQLVLAQLGIPANIIAVPARISELRHFGSKGLSWSAEFFHVVVSSPWAADLARLVWGDASIADRRPVPKSRKRAPRRPECRVDDEFVYLPIKAVRRIPNSEPVYNLTVSGDHSYLVSNVATFNSNSVMEAMASGHALISTRCGNVREMQESQRQHFGATGIEIVPRSVEAFAEALGTLTPERVAEMGALNATEIGERWSWQAWAPRYEALIRSVL